MLGITLLGRSHPKFTTLATSYPEKSCAGRSTISHQPRVDEEMSIPVVFNSTSLVAARSLSTPYTLWHVEIHCVLFAMFRSDSSAFSLVLVFFVHASLATLHLTLANQNVSSDTRPGQLLTGCDPALLSW